MYIYELLTANGGISREGLLNVLAFVCALVFALTLHELAHGLVALWNGDPTAKYYGRLSINPLKHFDLFGLLMMLLVGFGWAKPVPVNPDNFKKRKVGAITVSVAGVLTNIVLAFLFALPLVAIGQMTVVKDSSQYYFLYFLYFFSYCMVSLNVSFALFNLLPLFPLDGYRLLACLVNENNGFMRFLRKYSLYIMLGLIVLNYIPVISTYSPFNLLMGWVGNVIREGFCNFWRLII